MGRQFLSKITRRNAKEIQRIRQDESRMREETRQDDSGKESENCQPEKGAKKGLTIEVNPQILYIQSKNRKSLEKIIKMCYNYLWTLEKLY